MSLFGDRLVSKSALMSPCQRYRYVLSRIWGDDRKLLNFIMLNPSTADASKDDPTVHRCTERARRLGYGGLIVTNLFALRSTDPGNLYTDADPVGPENDGHLLASAVEAETVVCAWGHHGKLNGRAAWVLSLLRVDGGVEPKCLGVTKDKQPRHPLYLGYDVAMEDYEA